MLCECNTTQRGRKKRTCAWSKIFFNSKRFVFLEYEIKKVGKNLAKPWRFVHMFKSSKFILETF